MAHHKKSSKHKSKKQKMYRMRGCSKTSTCKNKKYLGGNKPAGLNLSYPYPSTTVPNPFLAYTGKGGNKIEQPNLPQNINGSNPIYPSSGPVSTGFNFLNASVLKGGCGDAMCSLGGGGGKHRVECKCSDCRPMHGGMGNNGIPYPDGLVGNPWTASTGGWPGVDGIGGDRNYLALNTYSPNDVSRQMTATGAAPPFSIGGAKMRKNRRGKQNGGTLSNFLGQDLINLGRQFQFGLGSTYNALAGYSAPANPMPWKGQLPNTPSVSALKNF